MDATESSAPAPPSTAEKELAKLEERYRHELLSDEERQELLEELLALRRRSDR